MSWTNEIVLKNYIQWQNISNCSESSSGVCILGKNANFSSVDKKKLTRTYKSVFRCFAHLVTINSVWSVWIGDCVSLPKIMCSFVPLLPLYLLCPPPVRLLHVSTPPPGVVCPPCVCVHPHLLYMWLHSALFLYTPKITACGNWLGWCQILTN